MIRKTKQNIQNIWNWIVDIISVDLSSKDHDSYLKWFPNLLFSFGLSILSWTFVSLFITSVGFILGISISEFHLPVSLILTLPLTNLFIKQLFDKKRLLFLMINLIFVLLIGWSSLKISYMFYDLSYDSQWYHMETIIALEEGWNPFRNQLSLHNNPNISSQNILNTYARGTEIVQTIIYKYYGKIEIAKGFNLMTVFMTFFFASSLFLRMKKSNLIFGLLAGFLLVFNPITIMQFLSFYLDATLYNFILSLIVVLLTFYMTHKNYFLIPVIFCISILWNIKLTAILYSTGFYVAFLVFSWYTEHVVLVFKSIIVYIFAAFLSIYILGISPYITNLISYGNPFYTDGGKDSKSFIYINTPSSLYYVSSIERFVYSIFSKSEILRGENKSHQLKTPFTYDRDELIRSKDDNTTGGFGPLFSGVFTISFLGLVFIILSKEYDFVKKSVVYLLFIILISSAFFPVSSYARFIPQFWIFPCVIALCCIYEKKILPVFIGSMLIVVMVANNYIILSEYLAFNINGTRQVESELSEIKKMSDNSELFVDFDLFRSNRIRFKENNILFKEQSVSLCNLNQKRILYEYIPESKILLCIQ